MLIRQLKHIFLKLTENNCIFGKIVVLKEVAPIFLFTCPVSKKIIFLIITVTILVNAIQINVMFSYIWNTNYTVTIKDIL